MRINSPPPEDGKGPGSEVILHGAAKGQLENGGIAYQVAADEKPVTHMTPELRARIRAKVFGVWKESEGSAWFIRGDGEDDRPAREQERDPAREGLARIQSLQAKIEELRQEKAFIWLNTETKGEVTLRSWRRLPEPWEYQKERSENYNKERIEALEKQIANIRAEIKPPPVMQQDPRRPQGEEAAAEGKPISIEVWDNKGHRYFYDEAAFDGRRITASRTLRDMRDITTLPQPLVSKLIASWSPPE